MIIFLNKPKKSDKKNLIYYFKYIKIMEKKGYTMYVREKTSSRPYLCPSSLLPSIVQLFDMMMIYVERRP